MVTSSLAGAATLLRGDAGQHVVRSLLADRGAVVTDVRRAQVLSRPGTQEVVRWRATTDRGPLDVVGVVRSGALPGSLHVVSFRGHEAGFFIVPDDPRLPGLSIASRSVALSDHLGMRVVRTRRRRYRPLVRAVVEATLEDGSTRWVKVLRPRRSGRLADVHERCAAVARVPEVVHADTSLGLVVLDHVPGTDLRGVARSANPALPDPGEIIRTVMQLATVPSPTSVRRTPPLLSLARSVTRLVAILPSEGPRIEALASEIEAQSDFVAADVPGPTIHGDLHAAQVQVAGGRLAGLVDLDDAGSGDPHDDLSRFLAHLVCTVDRPEALAAVPWAAAYRDEVVGIVGMDRLRPRAAAVLMSLALGPHRVQDPHWEERSRRRLDLAEHWLRDGATIHPPT